MTSTAESAPPPLPRVEPSDSEEVARAVKLALMLWEEGQHREAVRTLQRGAAQAEEAGNDLRALTLARTAADLAAYAQITPSAPPPAAPSTPPGAPAAGTPAPPDVEPSIVIPIDVTPMETPSDTVVAPVASSTTAPETNGAASTSPTSGVAPTSAPATNAASAPSASVAPSPSSAPAFPAPGAAASVAPPASNPPRSASVAPRKSETPTDGAPVSSRHSDPAIASGRDGAASVRPVNGAAAALAFPVTAREVRVAVKRSTLDEGLFVVRPLPAGAVPPAGAREAVLVFSDVESE